MNAARFCHSCGERLRDGANFCRSCGAQRSSQLPDPSARAAPAPQPPADRPVRGWQTATVAGAVVVIAAVLAAVLIARGANHESRPAQLRPAAVLTVTSPAPAEASAEQRTSTSSQPVTSESVTPSQSGAAGAQAGFATYRGRRFTAQIPSGWTLLEDEAQKEGYVQSKWRSPTTTEDTVLIDTSPATGLTLEEDAEPVHTALERSRGYEQVAYQSGDLTAVASWMWVFRVSGDERIDYFFNDCGRGFGVLGSSQAGHFDQLRSTYRAVAEAVHAVCR